VVARGGHLESRFLWTWRKGTARFTGVTAETAILLARIGGGAFDPDGNLIIEADTQLNGTYLFRISAKDGTVLQ
jgi:hypothetical protein